MSDEGKEEIITKEEIIEEKVEVEQETVAEEKKVAVPLVKPHQKFQQQGGYNAGFGGRGNKFGNAGIQRMGRGAQRGR